MVSQTISSSTTILWGVFTTIILMFIFFIVIAIFPLSFPSWVDITICLGFPTLVFLSGLTSIEATQTGLLNVFGQRQKTTISEGLSWLPPFTSITLFDNKEQSTDLGEIEMLSANHISMKVKVSYNWRIIDNYLVSNLDGNVINRGLSELVRNEIRGEMLNSRMSDVNFVNSNKTFIGAIIKSCNETAKSKWGIEITELFIVTIMPATESMINYYESRAKIDEIVEDSARIAKILGLTPREALDKYARERLKVSSIEHIYSVNEISRITRLIEKMLK